MKGRLKMADIIEEIKVLNEKARVLNNQRQQAMGAHKIATENYQNAIKQYAEKYGVNITAENFNQEYATIQAELEKSVANLKQQISDIETGKYKEKVQLEEVSEEPKTPEKVVYTTPIIEEKPASGVIENIVTQKKRGRPTKAKVEAPTTDDFPFDGGVPVNKEASEVIPSAPIATQQNEVVSPVIKSSEPLKNENGQSIVVPNAIYNVSQTPTVNPIAESNEIDLSVSPTVTPIVQSIPKVTVQPSNTNQGIVIGQPTVAPPVQDIVIGQPTVAEEPTQIVKPIVPPSQPSIVVGQPVTVTDDDDDGGDEDVPKLNWGNGGVSLNDFKGFSL